MRIQLYSEVDRLETVVIHTPGAEIETVTPASAEELLYNDVIPLGDVQREHARLAAVLSKIATVVEAGELLMQAVQTEVQRTQLALALMRPEVRRDVDEGWLRELGSLSPDEFLQAAVIGVPNRRAGFTDFLSARRYDIPALPNLYFMRDAAMAYRDSIVIGAMAYAVRRNEAILAKAMLQPHAPIMWDGSATDGSGLSLEGGDFLVAGPNVLVVGLSERTSTNGLDAVLAAIRQQIGVDEVLHVIAVQLPHHRTCIHLDMAATFLDHDCMLVYEPLILGRGRAPVVQCTLQPGQAPQMQYAESLPAALAAAGMPVKTVLCGNGRQVEGEREQWLAGTNVFAYGPGQVIGYDCNTETLAALSQAGFSVVPSDEVLSGRQDPCAPGRRIITISGTELARGGGGVRCMTLPLSRRST